MISDVGSQLLQALTVHAPWLVDKTAAAVFSVAVKEAWERIKSVMTAKELDAVESPSDMGDRTALRDVISRIETDKPDLIQEVLKRLKESATTIELTADGSGNQQAAVHNSSNVHITIK